MKQLYLILFALIMGFSVNLLAQQDVVKARMKIYDAANHIIVSQKVKNLETAVQNAVKDLSKKNIVLEKNNTSITRYGEEKTKFPNKEMIKSYISQDGKYWLDFFEHPNNDSLVYYRSVIAIPSWQDNTNYTGYNNAYISVYSKERSSLGALFNTDNMLFNIGIDLPFPVKLVKDLTEEQRVYIIKMVDELYTILKSLIDNCLVTNDREAFYKWEKENQSRYVPTGQMNINAQEQTTKPIELTSTERLYGLIQFWTEAKYNFAFFDKIPKVNWDKVLEEYIPLVQKEQSITEYYKTMNKLCALLKDGHTNIYPPSAARPETDDVPLVLSNISSKAIVTNVRESVKDVIPIGSEILKIDGVNTIEFLNSNIFPYISSSTAHILFDNGIRNMLRGEPGTKVNLTIKTSEGNEKSINLLRNSITDRSSFIVKRLKYPPYGDVGFRRIADGIAYVNINNFQNSKVNEEFLKLIDSLKNSKGVIIDIRNNSGGNSGVGYEIINCFTDKPYLGSAWKTRKHIAAYKAWGLYSANTTKEELDKMSKEEREEVLECIDVFKGNSWYSEKPSTITPPKGEKLNIPMVVLTGHNTASAAEDFLIALDNLKRATFVGEKTFGSTGQPLPLDLPGGGSARICTKRDTYPDGREFVGYGVEPHVLVERTLDDFTWKKDNILEKGIEVLKGLMKK